MEGVIKLFPFILLLYFPSSFASYWLPGHYEQARRYVEHIQSLSHSQVLVDIHPLNQNVAEGRSCQFTCLARTISGEGSISVQWSKEGQQLPFNAIDDGGVLTINSASQADSGRYVCTATYGDHIAKSYAYLSVDRYGPQEFRSAYYGNGVCQSDEKICGNSECVKLEYVCDGEPDCRDHTDEQNCPRYHHCQPNEFKCKNQHCVQKMWLCDGEDDCGDNSDEEHCGQKIQPNGCSPSQFKCLNVNQCIPNSFHCDGTNDCGDGSDEIGCVQPTVVEPPETSKQVEQGGTFKLTCRAVAVPDAYISWRLNWGPVCKPPRCIQSSERGIGVLTVTNVQPADQGAYTCEAINVKGRVLATPDCIVRIVGVATSQSQPPTLPPSTLPPLLCNKAGTDDSSNNYGDKCQCKPLVTGPRCDECRPGAFQLSEDSPQGCLKCFCFGITNDCHSSTYYRIKESLVFRNNPQGIYLSDIDENIEANAQFEYTYKGMLTYSGSHEKTFYWKLPQRFLGNKITAYGGKMTFQLRFSCSGRINNEPLVVIKGNGMTLVYRPQNPETTFVTDEAFNITVNTYETNYYHLNGQRSTREELMMTLVDLDAYLIRATHCFGQQVTSLGDVTWEVAVNRITNGGMALEVEMCNCPPGYIGTSCEMCAEGYERSKNGNYLGTCVPARPKIQCFADGSLDAQPIYGDVCTCKAYVTGATCNECIPGSFYLSHKNPDGCIRCFCSGVTKQCSSSSLYRTAVEINYLRGAHEILDVTLADEQNSIRLRELPRHEGVRLTLHGNELGSQILYWNLPEKFLGNKVTSYGGVLKYKFLYTGSQHLTPDDDVIIKGSDITLHHKTSQRIHPNTENVIEVPFYENEWGRPDGGLATRESLMMVLSDLSSILIKLTYSSDSTSSSLVFVSMEYAQSEYNGNEMALAVEECQCPEGYIGTSCEECADGWYRGSSLYLGICTRCQCNGHSSHCDKKTGVCIDCRDNTAGDHCEYCKPGFERDVSNIASAGCLPKTTPCNCNNHSPQGCDFASRCWRCEHNTEGQFCERCKKGFYGDATKGTAFDCLPCPCPGSSECYEVDGQPHCKNCPPGFTGPRCETCAPGYTPGTSPGSRTCQPIGEHVNSSVVFVPKIEAVKVEITPSGRVQRRPMDTMTWQCLVIPSAPDEVVVWKKVGRYSLPSKAVVVGKVLTIPNLQLEDSGDYRCILERWSGKSVFKTKDVRLDVKNPYNVKLVIDPEKATVTEGKSVSFHCRVQGDKCSKIEWYKGQELDMLPDGMAAGTNGVLKTQSAKLYHSGIYTCVATLKSGRKLSKIAMLNVKQSIPDPKVEPSILSVSDGEKAEFRCFVPGHPEYKITWENENGVRMKTENEILRFPYATISDSGRYVCNAIRPDGSQPSTRPVVTLNVVIRKLPQPIVKPRYIRINKHESAKFECVVPPGWSVEYAWKSKESNEVVAKGKTLQFADSNFDDAGKYTCVVRRPESGETRESDPGTLEVVEVAKPTLTPKVGEVEVGKPFTFYCDDKGMNGSVITWRKLDGHTIPPHYFAYNNRQLQIKSAELEDGGEYVCSIKSQFPVDSNTARLQVIPERPVRPVVQPLVQNVNENGTASLRCFVPNKPGAFVQWHKLNGQLPKGINPRDPTLFLAHASDEDSGEYICSTADHYGNPLDSDPARINIIKSVSIDVYPKIQHVSESDVSEIRCIVDNPSLLKMVRWKKHDGRLPKGAFVNKGVLSIPMTSYSDAGSYSCYIYGPTGNLTMSPKAELIVRRPIQPVVNPKTQTVKEGDDCEIVCSVPNNADVELKWERNDGNQFTDRVIDDGSGKLMISNTRFKDVGEYVCIAKDPVTGQKTKETATVEISLVPVVVPAKQSVDVGQPSEFTCVVHGDAKGQIKWYFDNPDGMPDDVIIDENKLMIPHSQLKHMGDFYCQIGKSRSNPGILIVKGSPPQPFASPSKQNVKIGNSASFNCDARSALPTTVEWEHNGEIVHEDDLHKIDGNTLTVNAVDNSDSGSYVCLATNDFGRSASNEVFLTVVPNDYPPTVEVDPPFWEGHYGDSHRFKCIATGEPTPNVVWEGPHGELPENVTVVNGSELEFSYGTLKHNGVYTCRATNSIGSAEDTGFVNIEPIISIRTNPPEINPRIPAGSPLSITCDALGDPKPTVMWIHDEERERGDLPDDYKAIHIDEKVITHPHLNIGNSGEYICQANSSFGIVSKKINITVVGLMSSSTVAILGGNNQRFHLGSREKLICITTAPDLIDKLEWIKDGSPVDSNSVEVLDNGVIQFRNFQTKDSGTYVCQAYLNGEMFASTKVNVYSMNSALPTTHFVTVDGDYVKIAVQGEWLPMRCALNDQNENENVRYEWSAMRDGHLLKKLSSANTIEALTGSPSESAIYSCDVFIDNAYAASAFVAVFIGEGKNSSPVVQEFDSNSEAHIKCPVPPIPESVTHWRRGANELSTSNTALKNHLTIKDFNANDEDKYVCEVSNDDFKLRATVNAKVYEPSVTRIRITGTLGKLHVGTSAWLQCTVEGQETTAVKWRKTDQSELPDNCYVENGRLSFDAVREDNRGLYECSAVLDKDSPPISMTKYLHVENAKRKRKHISEKLYNKIHKAEKKQRPLFSEWESSL